MRNITLGIASCASSPGEFDAMVCLRTSPWHDDGTPAARSISRKNPQQCPLFSCIVLAVVEAKRNPDDLGTAFSGLQGVMAWLCGKKVSLRPASDSLILPRTHTAQATGQTEIIPPVTSIDHSCTLPWGWSSTPVPSLRFPRTQSPSSSRLFLHRESSRRR